eukprot:347593-Chlamydomonas_euryale.AAC.1
MQSTEEQARSGKDRRGSCDGRPVIHVDKFAAEASPVKANVVTDAVAVARARQAASIGAALADGVMGTPDRAAADGRSSGCPGSPAVRKLVFSGADFSGGSNGSGGRSS